MIRQSQRLRRVLRKYALDARIARLNQAKAERERTALSAIEKRIVDARQSLARETNAPTGNGLAAHSEWFDRLAQASLDLQPAIDHSNIASVEALENMQRANRRLDQIEERVVEASRREDQRIDSQSAQQPRRRNSDKGVRP